MTSLPFKKIGEFDLIEIIQDAPYSLSVRAFQPGLKRPVFVKLLKPRVQNHQQWVERFNREAQVCAKLKHPHIVDVYTIGKQDEYIFMAMEFVPGISLRTLLDKEKKLSLTISIEIIRQLLSALDFAHQHQVIHRDVKPDNTMLDIRGQVRLTDFGLAYLGEEMTLTQQGSILGTPAYMSPEQVTGEVLTPASDYFALGAMFYEMLSGIKPFAGENYTACIQKILNENPLPLKQRLPEIPVKLSDLINRMMAKRPEDRLANPGQIVSVLGKIQSEPKSVSPEHELARLVKKYYVTAHPGGETPKTESAQTTGSKKPVLKQKRWVLPLALIVLLSVLLIVLLLWQGTNRQAKTNLAEIPSPVTIAADTFEKTTPAKDSISSIKTAQKKLPPGRAQFAKNTSQDLKAVVGNKTEPKQGLPAEKEEKNAGSAATETPPAPLPATGPGLLEIELSPWGSVSLDGKLLDSMVHRSRFRISPGRHRLVLSHPEFAPRIVEFQSRSGKTERVNYSFLEKAGFLSVEVRPWAEGYIDGKFFDTTPLKRLITISDGEHLLELKHPDYPTFREMVTITPGDTVFIRQRLDL